MEGSTMEAIKRFLQDDSGISATEYVVLAALITGGIVLAVTRVGTELGRFFNEMADWLSGRTFG